MARGKTFTPEMVAQHIDRTIGRLTILHVDTVRAERQNKRWATCRCQCGEMRVRELHNLLQAERRGSTPSCGCYTLEQIGQVNERKRRKAAAFTPVQHSEGETHHV